MGVVGAIAAVAIAGTSVAVQSNQQKIAEQKQKDAANDAAIAQKKLIDEQKKKDAEQKAKEEQLTQQAFMKTAATRTRTNSGAGALPGAVAEQAIGSVGTPQNAGKTLIGA